MASPRSFQHTYACLETHLIRTVRDVRLASCLFGMVWSILLRISVRTRAATHLATARQVYWRLPSD